MLSEWLWDIEGQANDSGGVSSHDPALLPPLLMLFCSARITSACCHISLISPSSSLLHLCFRMPHELLLSPHKFLSPLLSPAKHLPPLLVYSPEASGCQSPLLSPSQSYWKTGRAAQQEPCVCLPEAHLWQKISPRLGCFHTLIQSRMHLSARVFLLICVQRES